MAQTGFTPLLIYSSSTASNTPLATNLLNNSTGSELAINIADGKLFYKDSGGSVQTIAWKTTPTNAGGTGLTSYTAGDLTYYASGSAFTKLGIGTSGYFLTSSGSAPQWTNPNTLAVTSINFGTTGLTPSTSTKGAVTVAGTLVAANGGTGATTLTGYVYGNGTGAMTASTTIPNTSITGLGTMSTQNSTSVSITGGSIDGTSIGSTNPNLGTFNVLHGKTYSQTSTSSPYSIVDTGIYSNTATIGYGLGAIYDVCIGGDPYATGNTNYYSTIAGLIFVSYGYNGTTGGNYISYTQLGINAAPVFPAQLVVTAVFWNGSSESTFTTSPTTNQIRIKVTYQDTGNIGYNQTVYLVKRL